MIKLTPSTRILGLEILVFRSTFAAQTSHVSNLHVLRKEFAVDDLIGKSTAHDIALIQALLTGIVLKEGALMKIFLHVRHPTLMIFGLLLFGHERFVFRLSFGRAQVSPSFDLSPFLLGLLDRFALALHSLQLPKFPGGQLGLDIHSVGVVDVVDFLHHLVVPVSLLGRPGFGFLADLFLHHFVGSLSALFFLGSP